MNFYVVTYYDEGGDLIIDFWTRRPLYRTVMITLGKFLINTSTEILHAMLCRFSKRIHFQEND